jgi:ABC-2 type transport system permease protein
MKTIAKTANERRYWPLGQMVLARVREFTREPEALFWVYGFPILMIILLGVAFRNQGVEQITVDVEQGPSAEAITESLAGAPDGKFVARVVSSDEGRTRLRQAKTALVVVAKPASTDDGKPGYEYVFDPSRPDSVLARNAVDDVLQRAAGRQDVVRVTAQEFQEPGGRYIDFLVPGLLGASLMGGGLWGVGFVTVDMRIRKLLKRFLATPMKKTDFLGGIMISRMMFMVPEVIVLLVFARLAFGVVIYGSLFAVLALVLLGAVTFSGLGLLVASRAKTLETVSGLMNLVMLPMWLLSGIFFSSDRFPEAVQPIIRALPLTALIDSLRAVMQEGATLWSQLPQIGWLAAWAVVTFTLALRWFRWM